MPCDLSNADSVPSWIDGYFEKLNGMLTRAIWAASVISTLSPMGPRQGPSPDDFEHRRETGEIDVRAGRSERGRRRCMCSNPLYSTSENIRARQENRLSYYMRHV